MLKKFNIHSQHVQAQHTATDYYNSNWKSNLINSAFNNGKFQQTSVSQDKLPTLQSFLLVLKHGRKYTQGTFLKSENACSRPYISQNTQFKNLSIMQL